LCLRHVPSAVRSTRHLPGPSPGFRIRIEAFLGIVLLIAVFVVFEFHAREGNH
jgi:hypothetical protein